MVDITRYLGNIALIYSGVAMVTKLHQFKIVLRSLTL